MDIVFTRRGFRGAHAHRDSCRFVCSVRGLLLLHHDVMEILKKHKLKFVVNISKTVILVEWLLVLSAINYLNFGLLCLCMENLNAFLVRHALGLQ